MAHLELSFLESARLTSVEQSPKATSPQSDEPHRNVEQGLARPKTLPLPCTLCVESGPDQKVPDASPFPSLKHRNERLPPHPKPHHFVLDYAVRKRISRAMAGKGWANRRCTTPRRTTCLINRGICSATSTRGSWQVIDRILPTQRFGNGSLQISIQCRGCLEASFTESGQGWSRNRARRSYAVQRFPHFGCVRCCRHAMRHIRTPTILGRTCIRWR